MTKGDTVHYVEDNNNFNMHTEAVFQAIQCMTFTFIHLVDVLCKVTILFFFLYYRDNHNNLSLNILLKG